MNGVYDGKEVELFVCGEKCLIDFVLLGKNEVNVFVWIVGVE